MEQDDDLLYLLNRAAECAKIGDLVTAKSYIRKAALLTDSLIIYTQTKEQK